MSKMADLSYEIEQLYIDGMSPRTIALTLECPLDQVLAWLEEVNIIEQPYEDWVDKEMI